MTYALIASNIAWAAFAAFFVTKSLSAHKRIVALYDAREQKHQEREQALIDRTLVLVDNHRQDVQVWANRVQAPDVAVAQSVDPGDQIKQFTMYDDDDDLAAAFKEIG